jgi:hypothetical protein
LATILIPTKRIFLRVIRLYGNSHRDFHCAFLIARRLPVFGFRANSGTPELVTDTSSKDIDWIGPKKGNKWGPCISNGLEIFYRLFIDESGWPCPMCMEHKALVPTSLPPGLEYKAAGPPTSALPSGVRTTKARAAGEACEEFIAKLTERPPNRDAVFNAAVLAVKKIGPLSRKAFDHAWANQAPAEWKAAGRRKKQV